MSSTSSGRELGPYAKYVDFCQKFSPLLVCHLMVPTMAAAAGRESASLLSFPLSSKQLDKHFVYSREAMRSGRVWTLVTYMLCHADWRHFVSNAQGLLMSGPAAVESLGVSGAIATYLGAGIFGALDIPRIHRLGLERCFSSGWRYLRDQFGWLGFPLDFGLPLPDHVALATSSVMTRRETKAVLESWEYAWRSVESASKAVDDVAARLANTLVADLAESRRLVGASAGVSAFLAVDACRSVENFLLIVNKQRQPSLEDFSILLHGLCAARYFASEAQRAWNGPWSGVDHAAHLNGAACGLIAFAIAKFIHSYNKRRRRKPSDQIESASFRSPENTVSVDAPDLPLPATTQSMLENPSHSAQCSSVVQLP